MVDDLVYDIGMNTGSDTRHYLAKGFRVVAVEANPQLAEAVSIELADFILSGKLTILNIGIAEQEAELDFWVNRQHEWSSFDSELGHREDPEARCIKIQCQPLAWVFRKYGVPYYLKIDIEGSDAMALKSLNPADLPRFVSVEVGALTSIKLLASLGYPHFKLIDQFTHLSLENPPGWEMAMFMALGEVPASNAGFPFGSSGPFGRDLPGAWHTAAEIQQIWEYHRQLQKQNSTHRSAHWCDLHAALRPDDSGLAKKPPANPSDEMANLLKAFGDAVNRERQLALANRQWAERSDEWLAAERQTSQSLRERIKELEAERPAPGL